MMKTLGLIAISVGIAALTAARVSAQETGGVDRVTVKDNKTVVVTGGQTTPLKEKVTFDYDITVFTNATYQIKDGKERAIKEGQTLNRDGTVLNADGTTYPVYDHLAMTRGRVMLMKDGEESNLSGEFTLGDGSRVAPDGTYTGKSGSRRRLLDGEILRLDGGATPAKDSVSMIDGKVSVQKDGSKLDVPRGRTLMMNDGTKVFGEGYFIKRDGSRVTLTEGQTVIVEGVAVR